MEEEMVKVGEKVADFELEAFHNEQTVKIRLSDYRGKWVVMLFYPADFTFICPTELEEAAEHYGETKEAMARSDRVINARIEEKGKS